MQTPGNYGHICNQSGTIFATWLKKFPVEKNSAYILKQKNRIPPRPEIIRRPGYTSLNLNGELT